MPHLINCCIPGSFDDDLDICELFCRIEEMCDAWSYALSTYDSTYWTIGQCLARGPPNADVWVTDVLDPNNVISGRKSHGTC